MILYLPSIGCRLRNATGCNMLASGDHLDESGSSSHWVPKVSNISMVNILVQPVINLRVPPIITHLWWYWGWFVIGIATFSLKYESDIDHIRQNSGCSETALKLRPSNLLTQNDFDPSIKKAKPLQWMSLHSSHKLARRAWPSSHCDQPGGPVADGWYSCAESCGQWPKQHWVYNWTCCLAGRMWKPSQRLAHETWNPVESFR